MSLNRHDQRRDANEPDIVTALLENGFEVMRMSKPTDLLVWRQSGVGFALLEVKTATGHLTSDQETFFRKTVGLPRATVRTSDEALEAARKWC